MDETSAPIVELVTRPVEVAAALERVDRPVVGVDVERADAHRYFRTPALVQVGVEGTCVLLDTMAMPELPALTGFLAERTAVLHAVENDIVPLEVAGVSPPHVADTAVAAGLLGLPTGLGPLLAELLGVTLPGDKEALQRADWEQRPLTGEMVTYAAGDVVHLPALWADLERRLRDAGRWPWYTQELEATLQRARDDRRAWDRTKGAAGLAPQARATLRELWEERERIAREQDLAPQHLLRDEVLVSVAADPPGDTAALIERCGDRRRRGRVEPYAARLLAAVTRGLGGRPEEPRDDDRPREDSDRAAHDALRRARAQVARDLELDPGVLCPSRALWGAVVGDPGDARELCELAGLRPWQAELLGDVLWAAYRNARGDVT